MTTNNNKQTANNDDINSKQVKTEVKNNKHTANNKQRKEGSP